MKNLQCSDCRFSRIFSRCGNSKAERSSHPTQRLQRNGRYLCGQDAVWFEPKPQQGLFARIRKAIAFVMQRESLD
jgi:hypothetical protein